MVKSQDSLDGKLDSFDSSFGLEDLSDYNYEHKAAVAKLVNTCYCPRDLAVAIQRTAKREDLVKIGYEMININPMIAADIFKYTGDKAGFSRVKDLLFNSTDNNIQAYVYLIMGKDEGIGFLNEFCEALISNGNNPLLACRIAEETGNKDLFARAKEELRQRDPTEYSRYKPFNRTPIYLKIAKTARNW